MMRPPPRPTLFPSPPLSRSQFPSDGTTASAEHGKSERYPAQAGEVPREPVFLIVEIHHLSDRFAPQFGADLSGGEIGKSTRLNSSHGYISYAVFCLKKKTAS